MNSCLKLEVCAFFADEFRAALAAERRDDVELAPMQGACDERRRPASAEAQPASEIPILRLMGVCSGEAACPGGHARSPLPFPLPQGGEGDKGLLREFHVKTLHSCFELLLGPDRVEALLGEGAHLLTPAMARAYPQTLRESNEKPEHLHAYFSESVRAWVVVDAGVAPLTDEEQAAFRAATGGKMELLPVELHLLRANLRAALAQREATAIEIHSASQIAALQHRLADYTMAYDLIGRLIPQQGEQNIVDAILELFYMLCAARAVHLLLIQDESAGGSVQLFSLPAGSGKEDFRALLDSPEPWGEIDAQQGFYFQIRREDAKVLGAVVVEGAFLFEHQRNYLDIAHLLMPILRLALHNARSYEKLCNTEHELRASQMELERRVEDRTRELREKSQFLDSVIENIPNMIFMKRASDLRFELFNRAGEALVGHDRSELIGRNDYDFFPREQADFFTGKDRATLEQGDIVDILEEPIETPRGTRILHTKKLALKDEQGRPRYLLGISEDITERKQAEEVLRLHSAILANMMEGVCLVRAADGVFVFANPQFERMFGYGPGELLGKYVSIVNAPGEKSPEQMASEIIGELGRADVWAGEVHNIKKDGTTFWCHASVTTFDHPQFGEVWVAVHEDITERKRAELALLGAHASLEESRARIQSLVDSALDAVITIDHAGMVVDWSPQAEHLFGYSREQAMGREIAGLILPASHREAHRQGLARFVETGVSKIIGRRIEVSGLRADGSEFPVELAVSALKQHGVYFFSAYVRNITERKQVEATLKLHKTVIDTAQDGFWMYDTSGHLLEVNQAYADMIGYTREELTGMHISRLSLLSNTPELVQARMEKIISQGSSSHFETQHRHKDGHVVHFETSNIFMPEANLVFSFLRDITRRKEYEEELKRSNAELEQFSYAVSHDMRQPLRMISSYLQLIEMELGGQFDEEKRTYFNFAIEGAKRIDQMLVALLEYSRVGRMGGTQGWIESREVLDEALQYLQPAIAEAQAKLNIGGEWPHILANHDEILRLLQNLIGNAVKFRTAGRTPEITISSKAERDEWRLCVADNGVGIIPEQIKRLFQVFQRLQLRTAYEGNGVGLALCRKIAEHHKGLIWAESEGEGKGSKFYVALPVLGDESIPARKKAA